jgi:hypothetical protein
MKRAILGLVAFFGCATAQQQQQKELPMREAAPAARVAVIELGWDAIEDASRLAPPVVDVKSPKRYRGLVMDEARGIAQQCNRGPESLEDLRRHSSSQTPIETVAVEPDSKVPYRDIALRLHPGECTYFDGPAAEYVVKRLD